jgi:hypothetical protein
VLQEKLGAEFLLLETGEGEGRLKANGPDRCDPEKKKKKRLVVLPCNKSRTRCHHFPFSLVLRPEKVKAAIFPVFFGLVCLYLKDTDV